MSAFPLRRSVAEPDRDPSVVPLEDAGAVFEALASATAREIVSALSEDPLSPADLADRTGTSVQNVHYHLDRLADGGVVEVVDTWYSSRGNEMSVYAASSEALVLAADEDHASRLRTALSRLLGGVAVLAMASLAVQETVTGLLGNPLDGADTTGSGGDDGAGAPVADGGTTVADGEDGGDGADAADVGPEADTPRPTDEAAAEPTATGEPSATGDGAVGIQAEESTTVRAAEDTEAESLSRESTTVDNESAVETTTTVADTAANGADAAANLPPGALFFAGGLAVLVAVVAYWYWAGR